MVIIFFVDVGISIGGGVVGVIKVKSVALFLKHQGFYASGTSYLHLP